MPKTITSIPTRTIQIKKHPLNPSTLALLDHLRKGHTVPPIKVKKIKSRYVVTDGRHRLTAYKLLGMEEIKAYVSEPLNKP